jgi:hypothetical protein
MESSTYPFGPHIKIIKWKSFKFNVIEVMIERMNTAGDTEPKLSYTYKRNH